MMILADCSEILPNMLMHRTGDSPFRHFVQWVGSRRFRRSINRRFWSTIVDGHLDICKNHPKHDEKS